MPRIRKSPERASLSSTEPEERTRTLLENLAEDPGRFTLGELLQQREAAYQEILRLRHELASSSRLNRSPIPAPEATGPQVLRSARSVLEPGTLLTSRQLKEVLGISTSTIYKLLSEGILPAPIRIGAKVVRWKSEDVMAWVGRLRS